MLMRDLILNIIRDIIKDIIFLDRFLLGGDGIELVGGDDENLEGGQ